MSDLTWMIHDDDYGLFFYRAETAKEAAHLHADALDLPWGEVAEWQAERCEAMDGLDHEDPLIAMLVGFIGSVNCPGCDKVLRNYSLYQLGEDTGGNLSPFSEFGNRAHHQDGGLWCGEKCAMEGRRERGA